MTKKERAYLSNLVWDANFHIQGICNGTYLEKVYTTRQEKLAAVQCIANTMEPIAVLVGGDVDNSELIFNTIAYSSDETRSAAMRDYYTLRELKIIRTMLEDLAECYEEKADYCDSYKGSSENSRATELRKLASNFVE